MGKGALMHMSIVLPNEIMVMQSIQDIIAKLAGLCSCVCRSATEGRSRESNSDLCLAIMACAKYWEPLYLAAAFTYLAICASDLALCHCSGSVIVL